PCMWSQEARVERYLAPIVLFLTALLAWQSNHKAAQVCLLGIVSLWIVLIVPITITVKLLSLYGFTAIAALFFVNVAWLPIETLFVEILGRETTLTGRLPIWQGILTNFSSHPFFGVGYDAFWTISNREALRVIFAGSKWAASHAHNGYLDILNELGIIGGFL